MLRGTNVLASYSYPVRPRIRGEEGVVSGIQPSVLVARTHTRSRIVYAITISRDARRSRIRASFRFFDLFRPLILFLPYPILIYSFRTVEIFLSLFYNCIISYKYIYIYIRDTMSISINVGYIKGKIFGKRYEARRGDIWRSVDEARRVKRSALI